jgi:hypothetical protein
MKQQFYFLQGKSTFKRLSVFRHINKVIMNRTGAHTSSDPFEISNKNIGITITDKLKEEKQEEEEERYSCLCLLLIDGTRFETKIVHKGRDKFKILNDKYGGKYSDKIVDASDVIRCKVEI